MRGRQYPIGFPEWEVAEIEKFRDSNPTLYEWRKTAHLIVENFNRPRGTAEELAEALRQYEARQ